MEITVVEAGLFLTDVMFSIAIACTGGLMIHLGVQLHQRYGS